MSAPLLRAAACLVLVTTAGCVKRPEVRRSVDVAPPTPQIGPVVVSGLQQDVVDHPVHWRRRLTEGNGVIAPPREAWRVQLGGPVTAALANGGTQVYAVAAGSVAALQSDGQVRWSAAVDAVGGVTETDDGPVVGARDGALLALSSSTGQVSLAWSGSGRPRGSAVPLGAGHAWLSASGSLHLTGGASFSPAVSATGELSSDGRNAYFQTLDGELWSVTDKGPRFKAPVDGPGVGAPVVGDGRVYAAWDALRGKPGGVQAVDTATGRRLWFVSTPAPPSAGMALGRMLLVPLTDGSLLALDPESGATLWDTRLGPDELTCAPLIAGNSAWVGDAGGRFFRLDLDDGGVAWTVELGSPVTGDPVLAWGRLVVGLASGAVVALAEPTG